MALSSPAREGIPWYSIVESEAREESDGASRLR